MRLVNALFLIQYKLHLGRDDREIRQYSIGANSFGELSMQARKIDFVYFVRRIGVCRLVQSARTSPFRRLQGKPRIQGSRPFWWSSRRNDRWLVRR